MTITAEFTQDWSSPDADPWTDVNFGQINGDVKIIAGGMRPTTSHPARSVMYNGDIDPTKTLSSSVQLAQDGATPNDYAGPAFVNPADGSGYWMQIGASDIVRIFRQAPGDTIQGAFIAEGNFSISGSLASDIFRMDMTPSGVFTCYRNGAQQSTFTDTTYHAGLVPAVMLHWQNLNYMGLAAFGCDGLLNQVLGIDNVNGGTTIVSGDTITIGCTLGDTVTGATLSNGTDNLALTINSASPNFVYCAAVDMHVTAFAPGQALTLSITDGATSPSLAVGMVQIAGNTWTETTGIDATNGLLKDTTQAAVVGDGYEGPDTANSGLSSLTYGADGPHRNYDPAVPNGTITTGWHYDASAKSWEEITETTNRAEGAVAPFWRAQPSPLAAVVGVDYSYFFGGLVEGDRPITYALETGAYPDGLVINQATEVIEGIATESGDFTGLSISATNATGAETSAIFPIIVNPIIISSVTISDILQETATVSAGTNTAAGKLYVAVRTDGAYTQADAIIIKIGPALWLGNKTPIIGENSFSSSGLTAARTHYVGVYQESGGEVSLIATGTFLTLAYVGGPEKPEQCERYPDLISYAGIPVNHDLLFGWCGDNPKTLATDKLPAGLSVASNGKVTGTPTTQGTTDVTATATNVNGSGSGAFSWKIYTLQAPIPEGMTRKALVDAVIAYSDRYTDVELLANMDSMLTFAEHRMSRIMRNREMSGRALVPNSPGDEWLALPPDFDGMREVSITSDDGTRINLDAVTPQQATQRGSATGGYYYAVQANRLRIVGDHDGDIEITYYQRVPALIDDNDTNWVLQTNADIYQIAIQSQIELFVKNDLRSMALDKQLIEYFAEIALRDQKDRWSGGPISNRTDF